MTFTAAEIAHHLTGTVYGDGSVQLRSFAPANTAQAGDLTFAENEAYFAQAEQSAASAILVDGRFTSTKKVLISVANARVAFAKVISLFFPEPTFPAGIHPTAIISSLAEIDPTAFIGPFCVIGPRARIGARSALHASDHLGAECELGEDVHLFPR